MKILIASKFFYTRGGAELVAINTRRMLMAHGHEVRVLAMACPENIDLKESAGFPSEVRLFGSWSDKLKGALRTFGLGDVRRSVDMALDEFRPDIIHMHNVHTYLSPLIAERAARRGIAVVWTLHDYKPVCPSYSCRRPDGVICEECITHPSAVIKHRCMKGSLVASVMGWAEARRWNRRKLEKIVDAYIAPSSFMGAKLAQAGYDRSKIHVLCNFVDPDKMQSLQMTSDKDESSKPYFSYIGRLSQEKGVETMLKAAIKAGVALKIAGRGPLFDTLRLQYGVHTGIQFLGHLEASQVASLLKDSIASVLPSEWYENNPLGVIESLSVGTPVIGARMGGIPELIVEGRDGFTFEAGDVDSLSDVLKRTLVTSFNREEIAQEAALRFGIDEHYRRLMEIYNGVIRK